MLYVDKLNFNSENNQFSSLFRNLKIINFQTSTANLLRDNSFNLVCKGLFSAKLLIITDLNLEVFTRFCMFIASKISKQILMEPLQ